MGHPVYLLMNEWSHLAWHGLVVAASHAVLNLTKMWLIATHSNPFFCSRAIAVFIQLAIAFPVQVVIEHSEDRFAGPSLAKIP